MPTFLWEVTYVSHVSSFLCVWNSYKSGPWLGGDVSTNPSNCTPWMIIADSEFAFPTTKPQVHKYQMSAGGKRSADNKLLLEPWYHKTFCLKIKDSSFTFLEVSHYYVFSGCWTKAVPYHRFCLISEAMVPCQNTMNWPLHDENQLLPSILFMSEGKMKRRLDRWIGATSAAIDLLPILS